MGAHGVCRLLGAYHMTLWGKIIGGAAGFALGGPLGALLGALAGHAYDAIRAEGQGEGGDPTKSVAFTIGVVALGAKMAKADGIVTGAEVNAFREVFRVDDADAASVQRVFDLARRSTAGYEAYARQVAGLFGPGSPVLEQLVDCLFHIAKADGRVNEAELAYLHEVARIFGFDEREFDRIRVSNIGDEDCEPCQVLGVSSTASLEEIKGAYRKLVREHHPDRLIAQGMPAEAIKVASEKLAAINAAYDRLKASRYFQ